MTAEEIRQAIRFEAKYNTSVHCWDVVGKIELSETVHNYPRVGSFDKAKDFIVGKILHKLYDDQVSAMAEAVYDFCKHSRYIGESYEAFHEARDNILKLARYQPPKDYEFKEP